MIGPSDVPVLPRGVRQHFDRVRQIDVLLGPERVVMLDAISMAILAQVDGTKAIAAISDDLASAYETPRDVIEPDVIAFLTDLSEKGFLHVRAS